MAIKTLEPTEVYTPTDWQLEDLRELTEDNRKWSANFSEMGCYKTTTGLWLADAFVRNMDNPIVLFVTTKSGKGTYFDAIPKSLKDRSWRVFNITTKGAEVVYFGGMFNERLTTEEFLVRVHNSPSLILAHYHCFTKKSPIYPLLAGLTYDAIVVDEAHRMKDPKTQWTRNIKKLLCRGLRHVMTGTGFINNPAELWSLLNFLEPRVFSSYWAFRKRYCLEIEEGGFRKIVGIRPEHKDEFRQLRRMLGPRREMAKVHAGIKEPVFTPYPVELNTTQRRMYDEIKRNLEMLDQKGERIDSPNVLSQLNRLRQICVATPELVREYYDPVQERRVQEIRLIEPSSKLDALMELLDSLEWDAESRQQVVVFSNFRDPIELAKVRLDKANIPYLHMQQKHSDRERYEMWHDIFPRKEHRVFLTTLQLGSESINLSAAQYGVFLDRSWSPKDNNQGVARLYRPGQAGVPNIIHINAINTVDQRIERVVNLKTGWFREIFGEGDTE